ncbi:vesicle-associated membrane 5 [Pelobates cultripes]|uniref:Vesicle-associated membrane 5 n=1 Tax=Pelobates cultripes TaxID=61616 RepID=A0AAD1VYP3_PELCU|nr:vesicle-associated membrane 5 [Pelobates cultripes]
MSKQNQNIEMCRQEAEEVKILMKDNVEKVIEREGKLSELEDRSDKLLDMASNFQKTAKTVERHTRWQKWRWYFISGGIVVVFVVIIIIVILVMTSGGENRPAQETTEKNDAN